MHPSGGLQPVTSRGLEKYRIEFRDESLHYEYIYIYMCIYIYMYINIYIYIYVYIYIYLEVPL